MRTISRHGRTPLFALFGLFLISSGRFWLVQRFGDRCSSSGSGVLHYVLLGFSFGEALKYGVLMLVDAAPVEVLHAERVLAAAQVAAARIARLASIDLTVDAVGEA